LIGYRCGDPNEVGQPLAVLGTAGVRFDAIKQRPGFVGAEVDFLEVFEQFEALKHNILHRRRKKTSNVDVWLFRVTDSRGDVKLAHRKVRYEKIAQAA
jgi:hypothetical protein